MDKKILEKILEDLEETCFPIQIDWNKKDLYIKGLEIALEKNNINVSRETINY